MGSAKLWKFERQVFRFHTGAALLGVTLLSTAALAASGAGEPEAHEANPAEGDGGLPIYMQILLAIVLLFLSAVFAGLTIGIMGFDTLTLEIIADSGAEPDKSYARQLLPVRKKGHQALCTLVLGNMWANVMIAEFCADISPEGGGEGGGAGSGGLVGFLLSTFLILIFAEIIPMSICKSSKALKIAAAGVPVLKLFMIVLFPVAWPLGRFLDWLVKHDIGQIYDRNELKKLMVIHCETHGDKSGLLGSELQLLIGAMEFHEASVGDIMTPIDEVFMLDASDILSTDLLEKLWQRGHSRVPVFEGTRATVIGIVLVKDLILSSFAKGLTVRELVLRTHHTLHTVNDDVTLPAMLKYFQQGHAHLVMVQPAAATAAAFTPQGQQTDAAGTPSAAAFREHTAGTTADSVVGVLTLEDLVEKLIREEILDEYDEDGDAAAAAAATFSPTSRAKHQPAVNFFSYYVHPDRPRPLLEEQWLAAARFLCNTHEAFVHWRPRQVAKLLQECGDVELRAPTGGSPAPPQPPVSPVGFGPQQLIAAPPLPSDGATTMAPTAAKGTGESGDAEPSRFVLYRAGERCDWFVLILSGCVEVNIFAEGFVGEKRTFSSLGEAALLSAPGSSYTPNFTARVRGNTRIVRVTRAQYDAAQRESPLGSSYSPVIAAGGAVEQTALPAGDSDRQSFVREGERRVHQKEAEFTVSY